MESHDIDRIETPAPVRAPGRRWGALFGTLGVVSLIALTLSASVAGAASPSPTPAGAGTIVVVDGAVQAGSAGLAGSAVSAVSSAEIEKMDAAFKEYASCMREHGVEMPDPVTITTEATGPLDATAAIVPISGVVTVTGTAQALAFDPASEEFTAADAACGSILEGAGILKATSVAGEAGPVSVGSADGAGTAGTIVVVGGALPAGSSAEIAKMDAAFTKYTACMREHGVEMPDPVKLEVSGPLAPAAATELVPVTGSAPALSVDPASEKFTVADKACSPILEDAGIHSATITSTSVLDGAVEAPASH
jgi:hypothetical protein